MIAVEDRDIRRTGFAKSVIQIAGLRVAVLLPGDIAAPVMEQNCLNSSRSPSSST